MKTRKKLGLGLLAAIVAVGGGVQAWRSARTRVAAEDLAMAMQRAERAAAAEARVHGQSLATAAIGSREPAVSKPKEPAPSGEAVIYTSRPPGKKLVSPPPQATANLLRRFRSGLVLDYGGFYSRAGLTPEQVAGFEVIVTEHEGRTRDLQAVMAEQKLGADDPAIMTLRRQEDERFAAGLRELLGVDGKRQLDEYEFAQPERRFLGDVVGRLLFTDMPLTPQQTKALTALLREYRATDSTLSAPRWEAIITGAQTILQPGQFREFQLQARAVQQPEAAELRRLVDRAKHP